MLLALHPADLPVVLVSMMSELTSHPISSTYVASVGSSHLRSPDSEMMRARNRVQSMGFCVGRTIVKILD